MILDFGVTCVHCQWLGLRKECNGGKQDDEYKHKERKVIMHHGVV
jgi:hypothetical protein